MMHFALSAISYVMIALCMEGALQRSPVAWQSWQLQIRYGQIFGWISIRIQYVNKRDWQVTGVDQYAMRSFSDALEAIPMALAENSGLGGIEVHF